MYKEYFPLLTNTETIYLDTAASAQKPDSVLKTMDNFYRTSYANVHRGQCAIAIQATTLYEQARQTVADFIGATPGEIVFTKGATESINLVAFGLEHLIKPNDEILVSIAEHHANFVPWQQLALRTGAIFKTFNVLPDGRFDLDDFERKLSLRTKIVAVSQLSNVLGIVNPIHEIVKMAHAKDIPVLVDGAQGVAHLPLSLKELDCDYYVFSGHKIYGPTGIGVLYAKPEALERLTPYQFGGDMIKTVTVEKTEFADIPARFEAGTPPFPEAIGLAAAINFVSKIGMDTIYGHESELTQYLMERLKEIKNLSILGDYPEKQGLVSFNIGDIHPADLAFVLAKDNICTRVGHHCAMPIHTFFGRQVSLRVSLGIYNDREDIDCFITSLHKALHLLGEE
ncbi:MAG: cysteine desulfurase [Alphaproteobacteria bacterium]|nr:cysteine desulfurase [Alphaproteobacteria bacterium]